VPGKHTPGKPRLLQPGSAAIRATGLGARTLQRGSRMLVFLRDALQTGGALGIAALLLSAPATAGKLRDAGRETRTPSSSSNSSNSSSSSSRESRSSSRIGDDGALALYYILLSPWVGPHAALEPGERGRPVFEDYPYAHGSNGLLRYPEPVHDEETDGESESGERVRPGPPLSGKSVAGQVRVEGGYILGGVYRGGMGGRLMIPGRLEVDLNVNGLAEPLPDGSVDRATFGNAHVGVRFAQNEQVQFRTGLGYQQFADAMGVEPGFDFSYGFDAQLGARLILGISGNLGSAGHAFVGQVRGSLGIMIDRFEIYAGYDHISIGDVPLGGPAAGIRAWL
jgi:hypothetical protein